MIDENKITLERQYLKTQLGGEKIMSYDVIQETHQWRRKNNRGNTLKYNPSNNVYIYICRAWYELSI